MCPMEATALDSIDSRTEEIRNDLDLAARYTADVRQKVTGLTGSIWTQNINTAHRAAKRIHTGYVWINNSSQHFMGAPFGGVKQSGIGREECFAELMEFTYTKNVNLKLG